MFPFHGSKVFSLKTINGTMGEILNKNQNEVISTINIIDNKIKQPTNK